MLTFFVTIVEENLTNYTSIFVPSGNRFSKLNSINSKLEPKLFDSSGVFQNSSKPLYLFCKL